MITRIELLDSKYIIQHDNGTNLKAYRHGNSEVWRDLTGDGLVLSLVQKIEDLQKELAECYDREFWGDIND